MAPLLVSRRRMLQSLSAGFGYLALRGLCQAATPSTEGPLAARAAHFTPRARRVIFLYMRGGPSQMETFDYKPRLDADHGKPSRTPRMQYFGSQWKFKQHGQCGRWISDLFPHVAGHADDLCVLNAVQSDHLNHSEASDFFHTGSFQFERPSMGAWVLYGLGTENENLPGFVTVKPPVQWGGARYYGNSFLPAAFQGMPVGTMGQPLRQAKVPNLANPRLRPDAQRRQLDLVQSLNRGLLDRTGAEGALEGVIESFELAFRMQTEMPALMDLTRETKETLDLYGIGGGPTDDFGQQCLFARRLAESGVRFIELTHDNWDHHGSVSRLMPANASQVDKPIAGLLTDLKRRGLLDDTLVLWGGEFGRTPDDPTTDGRGHNKDGFTVWLAGGGVKAGTAHGKTDDHGHAAVENAVHVHDLHATMLHLLGLDHTRLTYRYAGRDFRLTDVRGKIVQAILA